MCEYARTAHVSLRWVNKVPRSRFLQRNQSAERVGHVLDLLSLSAHALSLQQLSRQLGMHPSTAHRLLRTLEDQQLIIRQDSTELYRLGPKILTLSTRMLNQYPVRDIAAPYLYRLASDLGHTAVLAQYANGYITYLDCKEGPDPLNIVLRSGGTVPAHCVPSGRVQLAFLPRKELEQFIERGLEPCRGADSGGPTSADALRRKLASIRQRGYEAGGGWLPGVAGLAVPILDLDQQPIAAISMVTFAGQVDPKQIPEMAAMIKAAADEIAAKMGAVRPQASTVTAAAR
jgi:IclR family KDG regulon transcriptional repressor